MYEPREVDVRWARSMLGMIRDGGILGYKSNRLIYKVDHRNKQLVLTNVDQLEDEHSRETHDKGCAVFAALGYKVKPARQIAV